MVAGRLIAVLFLGAAISLARGPEAKIYINLPGGQSLQGASIGIHDAATGTLATKAACQSPPAFLTAVCIVPPGGYYITLDRAGFWPYTTVPFNIAAGQIIPLQPNMLARTPWIGGSDILTYLSVILVVLGLFREQLIGALIHYPKISLVVGEDVPYCHLALMNFAHMQSEIGGSQPTGGVDEFMVFFCRIFVKNVGTGEVTDVEVFVSSMWDIEGDPQNERLTDVDFLPLNLRWANSWAFYRPQPKLENDAPLHKSRISAGIGRFCDLGFVVEPSAADRYFSTARIRNDQHGTEAQFQFALETLDTKHANWANKHRLLELAIDGGNMETEFFYVELKVHGTWDRGRGPEIFVLRVAEPRLVKLAGKPTWRFHFYAITELLRKVRNFVVR